MGVVRQVKGNWKRSTERRACAEQFVLNLHAAIERPLQ